MTSDGAYLQAVMRLAAPPGGDPLQRVQIQRRKISLTGLLGLRVTTDEQIGEWLTLYWMWKEAGQLENAIEALQAAQLEAASAKSGYNLNSLEQALRREGLPPMPLR